MPSTVAATPVKGAVVEESPDAPMEAAAFDFVESYIQGAASAPLKSTTLTSFVVAAGVMTSTGT